MVRTVFGFLDDLLFKIAFGSEHSGKLLLCLLNALLLLEGDDRLAAVTILNPFNPKAHPDDKLTILDVKAQDHRGRRYNIEVQVAPQVAFVRRALYYLGRLYCDQLGEGEHFQRLERCTGIAILDFALFPGLPELRHVFGWRNLATGRELTDAQELHFFELAKFDRRRPARLRTRLEKWLHILKYGEECVDSEKRIAPALLSEEGIAMAIKTLRAANADRETRELLEARAKARHDEASRLFDAREEGLREGRRETIIRLLAGGISAEAVGRALGLTVDQVTALTVNSAAPGSASLPS